MKNNVVTKYIECNYCKYIQRYQFIPFSFSCPFINCCFCRNYLDIRLCKSSSKEDFLYFSKYRNYDLLYLKKILRNNCYEFKNIIECACNCNITIENIATVFEVTNSTVRRWKKGVTKPCLKIQKSIISYVKETLGMK